MDEQQKVMDGLMRPARLANIIGQSPQYVRDDITSLVIGQQIPGSFGDLIKRSVGITEELKKIHGTNVVPMVGRRTAS